MSQFHRIVCYGQNHREFVMTLWQEVFGHSTAHNAPSLVIGKKEEVADGLFFVAENVPNGKVIGIVMAGYDGHRGCIYCLAVIPELQRKGIGSDLVRHAEWALTELGCVKINLQITEGNEEVTGFYQGLGYLVEKRVSMGKIIPQNVADESSE